MKIALRIDDIGAASKRHEVYSKKWRGLGNFLFFKYLKPFRAWGPYPEMGPVEWDTVFDVLERSGARLTVAVTAAWVERDGRLVPFPEKYPAEAERIRAGADAGLVEIANHGLTHCVLHGKRFRPRLLTSNRTYHREFWDWIPEAVHREHVRRSQEILEGYFRHEVVTFVPPGNVFSSATLRACAENGIRVVNCQTAAAEMEGIRVIGNERVMAFHDRELVLEGVDWLERKIREFPENTEYVFVRDL